MCDEWMPLVRFPLAPGDFDRLPRNGAYKYEYLYEGGMAWLSPNPRAFHGRLDLAKFAPDPSETAADVVLEPLRQEDHEALASLFSAAFARIQPYGGLDDEHRLAAARTSLERTFTGVDGPWIPQASWTAREDSQLVGGILLTLLPDGDAADLDDRRWQSLAKT